jgi:hypothetical protein
MGRNLPRICAWIFALFHVLVVGTTLLSTGGHGEGQAFTVLLFNLPLVLLLQVLPGGGHVLYDSPAAYVGFFLIAGTLMYAAIGYGFGFLLRALAAAAKQTSERRTPVDVKSARTLTLKMAIWFVGLDILVFAAIVGLGAATSLPMQGLRGAWLALHLPALAVAGALLSDFAPLQGPMPFAIQLGFAVVCLLQAAATGAFIGWLAATLRFHAAATPVNRDS